MNSHLKVVPSSSDEKQQRISAGLTYALNPDKSLEALAEELSIPIDKICAWYAEDGWKSYRDQVKEIIRRDLNAELSKFANNTRELLVLDAMQMRSHLIPMMRSYQPENFKEYIAAWKELARIMNQEDLRIPIVVDETEQSIQANVSDEMKSTHEQLIEGFMDKEGIDFNAMGRLEKVSNPD